MTYFASMCLWFLRWDLIFARSTGRNPDHIAAISRAIDEWELILWQQQYRL